MATAEKNNVNHEIECRLCPEGESPVYVGETSRNLYTRGKEHASNLHRTPGEESESEPSFMKRHFEEYHRDAEIRNSFKARVTKKNTDSLSRQVREGVYIRRSTRRTMNNKSEWFQPPIFRIRSEIVRE